MDTQIAMSKLALSAQNRTFFTSGPFFIKSNVKLFINDHPKMVNKVLAKNSYKKTEFYHVEEIRLQFWKKFILTKLNEMLPDYDIFIKTKNVTFIEDKNHKNQYNHVTFHCQKDEIGRKVWISMRLTYAEPIIVEIKSESESDSDIEPLSEDEYTD